MRNNRNYTMCKLTIICCLLLSSIASSENIKHVIVRFDDGDKSGSALFSKEAIVSFLSVTKNLTISKSPHMVWGGKPVKFWFDFENSKYHFVSYEGGYTALKVSADDNNDVKYLNFDFDDNKTFESFFKNEIIALRFTAYPSPLINEKKRMLIKSANIPKFDVIVDRAAPKEASRQ
jgi:hypothetical protein